MVKQHHDFCIRCGHQVPPSPLLTRTGHVWKASVWRSAVHSTVNRSFVTHCSCKFGQLPALFETNLSSLYTAIIKTHKVTGKMKRSDTVWQELSQSMSLLGGLGSSTQPCHILKEKIQPAPGVQPARFHLGYQSLMFIVSFSSHLRFWMWCFTSVPWFQPWLLFTMILAVTQVTLASATVSNAYTSRQ